MAGEWTPRDGWNHSSDAGFATRGFTLLELTIVMSVLLFAFLAMSQSLVTSMRLNESNRENAIATDALRGTMEILEGNEEFPKLFALYNSVPDDDPGVPGSAPGAGFAVPGLQPMDDDADGLVGEIVFPVFEDAGVVQLREDVEDERLGMPRDLNGDALVDSLDHSADYRLLPVALRLRWNAHGRERWMEIRTLLADR